MPEYLLPDPGEGLTEAEIVEWKVKVGDVIEINDIVVDVETAKSIVELPSPYAGTVLALLAAEGDMVPVGTPIIRIGSPDEEAAPAAPAEPDDLGEIDLSNPAASGGGEGESLVGRAKAERGPTRRARRKPGHEVAGELTARADVHDVFNAGTTGQHERVEHVVNSLLEDSARQGGHDTTAGSAPVPARSARTAPSDAEVQRQIEVPRAPGEVRVLAKPPVRMLAKQLGVDLATLRGTGPQGSITRDDVQGAAHGAPEVEQTAPVPRSSGDAARERREPIKGVRKMMGQAMVDSAFTAPHVTEWVTVDVTPTMELVARLRARREFRDVKVSPLLVLARAVCLAMRRTPEINSYWDDAAQEVCFKSYVNLGIAAATPRGLVVPNVKDAEQLSLPELATALGELTATAREGKTQPADMAGGTFTITNVGVFGIDAGTPIINPGESAILAFGAAKRQPWVVGTGDEERIEIRDVATLALSFDHRHIDGEKGSRFLADIAGIMSDPGTALLF
ncbi:dihydrolipoamide acetyltransferase family protein [Alteromonas gracilis]